MGLRYTTEEISQYFQNQGCELLDEYCGTYSPMDYKCKCGRYATTTWNNFSKGKRCGYCTKYRHKYTLQEVRKIFKDHGCELLEHEYYNNKKPLKYRCKCGRESAISLVALTYQKQHCYYCGLEKNKKEGHHAWNPNREQVKLDRKFRAKCYKMLSSTLQATDQKKVGRTSDMLGYGPQELQDHIRQHPNWELIKDTDWHLDHIFPIAAFLENGIRDIKIINALDNLQPLPGKENISKSDTYNKQDFLEWLNTKGVLNENI